MELNYLTETEFDSKIDAIQASYSATEAQLSDAQDHFFFIDGSEITVEKVYTVEYLELVAASLDIIVNDY